MRTLAGSDFHEGDEAATIDLTLINHGRRQPSLTNARNADCVHNPGFTKPLIGWLMAAGKAGSLSNFIK